MKSKFLLLSLLVSFVAYGQNDNVLLDREFWRSSPSVEMVKTKIAEGNDPTAMTGSAFDATTYAILDKAPLASIQYLLDIEGNEVTKSTHDGRNYLIWAAYSGNVELTKDLIK